MWPWGHAAVGYLVYSLVVRSRGETPGGLAVLALGVGTQFPDLVDKPFGWTLGILPGGRSLAHSLLTFALVTAVLVYITRRSRHRRLTFAFSVGYLTHTLSDGLAAAVDGAYGDLSYLLWPLLPMPAYETEQTFVAHFAQLSLDSWLAVEGGLIVLAIVLWQLDGRPGLATVRRLSALSVRRVRQIVSQ